VKSLAILVSVILVFALFGGPIALMVLRTKPQGKFAKKIRDILVFLLSVFSLCMGAAIILTKVTLIIKMIAFFGAFCSIYAILHIRNEWKSKKR
jgi:hypothetical protein